MKKAIFCIAGYFLLFLSQTGTSFSQIVYEAPKKKLIDFGHHSPSFLDLKDHMKDYENGPFDGVSIKLSVAAGKGDVFMTDNWDNVSSEARDSELKLALSLKQSTILTDNFVVIFGGSQMDWFSDEDWAKVDAHLRYVAHLAKAAHCVGILWDAEPYKPGKNPWRVADQENISKYSYEGYYDQVRKRGRQFIQALQEEFPGIIIFSLRELSDWQNGSPFSGKILPVVDKENVKSELKDAWWSLHVPFYIGILDAIQPDVTFIDGNEEAYYYTSALEYYKVRNTLIDDARALVPPSLWVKHSALYKIGHAITAEYIAGNWLGLLSSFPYRLTGQGVMMTTVERAKWFEHNAYYALRTSDGYAWLYTEGINWWTGEKVPEGFLNALLSAKKKVASGQALGYEIDQMIKDAQAKAEVYYKNK